MGSQIVDVWHTRAPWPQGMTVSRRRDGDQTSPVEPFDTSADDASLIAACIAGQPAAFDVIVQRHGRTVFQVCYRFTGNHADASDLTQDTFVRAYKALRSFKGTAAFRTWLYRIAVNVCLNKVSGRSGVADPLDAASHVDTRTERPDEPVLRAERARMVRAAIAKLPPRQRATVILRVYHELSYQEISRIVGTSVGAVKANVFHALNNLRRLLSTEDAD